MSVGSEPKKRTRWVHRFVSGRSPTPLNVGFETRRQGRMVAALSGRLGPFLSIGEVLRSAVARHDSMVLSFDSRLWEWNGGSRERMVDLVYGAHPMISNSAEMRLVTSGGTSGK